MSSRCKQRMLAALVAAALFPIPAPVASGSMGDGGGATVAVDKTIEAVNPTPCEEEFALRLTVQGTSDAGVVDALLILDRSASMEDGGNACTIPGPENPYDCEQAGGRWGPQPLTSVKQGAELFVSLLRDADRAGLVSYASEATLDEELTFDHDAVGDAVEDLDPAGATNIAGALERATAELAANARPDALKVLILMSDGIANRSLADCGECGRYPCAPTCCTDDALARAQAARDLGFEVYSIFYPNISEADEGCTVEEVEALARQTMEEIASGPEYFFVPETPDELAMVYAAIAARILPSAVDLSVTDAIAPEFRIVEGSADPEPSLVEEGLVVWNLDLLGNETREFSYRLERASLQTPPGTYPTSLSAVVDYTDPASGEPVTLEFPPTEGVLAGESCFEPAIDVEKLVSLDGEVWLDADLETGPEVYVGRDVFFRFVVTNSGNVTLEALTLTDDAFDLAGACSLPASLAPGESFTCDFGPVEAEEGQHRDTALAGAAAEDVLVEDTDDAHYLGVTDCTGQGDAAILFKGSCAVGTPVKFKLAGPPNARYRLFLDHGAGPVVVPGVGTLCLDAGPDAEVLSDGYLNWKGYQSLWWSIPDDPTLIGQELVAQMAAVESRPPDLVHISNALRFTVCDENGPACEGGVHEIDYFMAVYYDGTFPASITTGAYDAADPSGVAGEITFDFDPEDPPLLPLVSADQGIRITKVEMFTGVLMIHAEVRGCNFPDGRLPDATRFASTVGEVVAEKVLDTSCATPLGAGSRFPPIFVTGVVDLASAPPGDCD